MFISSLKSVDTDDGDVSRQEKGLPIIKLPLDISRFAFVTQGDSSTKYLYPKDMSKGSSGADFFISAT
ncbi:wsv066 [White spot syndrome virus]|uniref:Wsv066 n=4 Tax=White spot syndrome virus TaxID=342409 RepID=Q8VBA8_WSSVS|nr:wsv066 [Shrimp white spot syndrome virus]AFX59443.1 wsv066 [White spot syndrome virus]AAL33070.1 wsv066 [Shrimp white spot syndrome virus]AAL88991.1 WSSV123 [Shrimp white spot syndrome virus]AWQ60255.1 wsv066 [Shrimp white spot syndrome virus]AWQ60673.1 wsv066 [Shrimp white spot syndrome virus]